jgi:hypothetical protein
MLVFAARERSVVSAAEPEAEFYRGINLNGPPVVIDGRAWEGKDAPHVVCHDRAFEKQTVPLIPATDPERALMIRSSRWGGNRNHVELTQVPAGLYTVFLYVWEDNNPEVFSIALNDRVVAANYRSGKAGTWERLGPWYVAVDNGVIRLTSQGGAANFSGIEVWRGKHDGAGIVPFLAEDVAFFESRIRPLLIARCYECHSATAKELQGGLLVDSSPGLRTGGTLGPAVIPGDVDQSLLVQVVRYQNPDLQMPPTGRLSATEIADLEEWVRRGAPDPRLKAAQAVRRRVDLDQARDFWSLRPIVDPAPPEVQHAEWPLNDVDRFVLAKMEQAGLAPSVDAERRSWLRRVTYDLIGLPPTPADIAAFVSDDSPDAFVKVVERLLASPQYGERWGRHWLDVVRYADTAGDNSDFPIPQMYRYRNWVISAFNRDLPYDQFVREQLAGDLLPSESLEQRQERLIATGYIANARRFGSRVDDYPQHLTIEDTLDNLGRAFLGLTLNCARCHDHKFDPVTVEDYYALYGILHSTRYPWPGIELDQKQRDLVPLAPPEEVEAAVQARRARQAELDAAVKQLEQALKNAAGDEKSRLEKELAAAKSSADRFSRTPLPFEQAYAVVDAARIEDAAIQLKGDPSRLGPVVRRRFLAVLGGAELPPEDRTSGRLQLAEWIVDPQNPLTARVMVNRIWRGHFGKGIVPTPNDFGRQGKPPTHPELLDWLACRFRESGWSIKSLHRWIVLSRTYRLSSQPTAEAAARDPTNEWYSAFPRRRLDAEAIRDTLLLLGGNLDLTPGGPHPFPPQTEWKFTQHNPFKAVYETNRRSVYLMTQRIQRHPYLAIFDGADPSASTPLRLTSTTPLQALYLLNDPFVHAQAERFARRLLDLASHDAARLDAAFEFCFGRLPDVEEQAEGLRFLAAVSASLRESGIVEQQVAEHAWQALARTLFRLNEFVYVD